MKLLSILILLMSIAFVGCQDKNKPEYRYYVSASAKQFGCFKPGSYWIFKNDSTGTEDSVYVLSLVQDTTFVQNNGDVVEAKEYYNCNIRSSSDTGFKETIIVVAQSNDKMTFTYKLEYPLTSSQASWRVDVYEINESGQLFPNTISGTTLITSYGTLTLNDSTFSNVSQFKSTNVIRQPSNGPQQTDRQLYITKGTGIVKWYTKYSDESTESWSVTRYHVII
jgi:hypothetical protein